MTLACVPGSHVWVNARCRMTAPDFPSPLSLSPSKVQTFGERVVLFILNVVIFGRLERKLDDDDMFFLPHSVREQAKILWRDGAAVGFYTTKAKGRGRGWPPLCQALGEGSLSTSLTWGASLGPAVTTRSASVSMNPRYGLHDHPASLPGRPAGNRPRETLASVNGADGLCKHSAFLSCSQSSQEKDHC